MSRVAFAAAHVAAGSDGRIDWEATLGFRRHLWHHGLGVAEAMDTAQRGGALDWPSAYELIRRTAAEAGGRLCAGAATDHAEPRTLADVRAAYEHQCELIEATGAQVVVMASRALPSVATSPDDYREVYGAVLRQLERPPIIHWLGEMFDPRLAGYWGAEPDETVLAIVRDNEVDGVKVSLLDAEREVALRERLPDGVRLYTGDDFNYPELIASGSDALLGVFAAIAPAAESALAALDQGDRAAYDRILAPTVPLARKLFEPPTFDYKTGIAYLAWLNGHQEHFRMLGGMEAARSAEHLAEVRELAERAGLA